MKTQPIVPAQVDFSDAAAPRAPAFGDIYHARAGALAQARHVFLAGNGLPRRWAGRPRFVILETGFGLGNNFLASWAAWRADPLRCQRLVFISVEKHPLRREDLARAHAASPEPSLAAQLLATWPPLTPNLHPLDFEGGRVRLLLALGDARAWLRELVAEVDAFYLDGFAPDRNPEIWDAYLLKSLARLAADDATAATWSVANDVRAGLANAGFALEKATGFATKRQMTVARFAPRHPMQRPPGRLALAPQASEALVIGAGLAGAACALALARQGFDRIAVLDARPQPAEAASGNPGGLFHGTFNPDDGPHARFNRAATLATQRLLDELPSLPWRQQGLLRLESGRDLAAMQALLARQQLPADYLQALSAEQAAALAGLPLGQPAWFYPGGGALPPAAYVRAMLAASGARLQLNCAVAKLRQLADGAWQALDSAGAVLAEAPALVLAGGCEGQALLQDLAPALPLLQQRGQLTHLARAARVPALPVAGAGYALADGQGGLWCGATSQDDDAEPGLRASDQARNLAQWAALAGLAQAPVEVPLAGRVAWRLMAPDRLPLVGGLALPAAQQPSERQDQLRLLRRRPGLVLCMALGSRGIGWAALCAQVAAARLSGAPVPLEADLLDAIDPARFALKQQQLSR